MPAQVDAHSPSAALQKTQQGFIRARCTLGQLLSSTTKGSAAAPLLAARSRSEPEPAMQAGDPARLQAWK